MSCLACGAEETALEAVLSPHDLAEWLCVPCLVVALEADNEPLPQGSGVQPQNLHSRTCSGLKHTCPRPVVHHYLNHSWCQVCAPPPRPPIPAPISRATDNAADDGMSDALTIVQGAFPGLTILEVWPHPYGAPD